MKLHLPASLLSALLAAAPAVHAAVTDITPTVNPTEIAPSKLPQGTTTATNQYYVLTQDVTIKTEATGSTTAFISSGTQPTYIFTSKTPDNPETSGIDERYGLTFSGIDGTTGNPDTHRVFRDISLHIEDLESLVLDGNTASAAAGYTSAPGAFLSASKVSNSVVKNVGKVLFADTWSQLWSRSNTGGVLSIINPNNTFSFEDCGSVTFRNTHAAQVHETEVAATIQVAGGAIYAGVNANGLNFKNNGAVLFDRSSVSAVEVDTTTYGGAICIYSGDVNFTGNDSVTFTSCAARHESSSSYGGAISLHNGIEINRWRNVLSLIDNKDVTFSNNSASGKGHTSGGAIAAWHDDRILIKNNSGAVTFSGNYAYNEGGAIFAKAAVKADGKMYGPEITISGNHSVKFTGNYVGREEDGKTNVYGGAVYAASGMTLANNDTVEFSGNYLTTSNRYTGYGAAIYIGAELSDASLVIAGNNRVVFGNNYVKEYSNSISGDCHMGSIYGENGDAENVFSTSSSSTSTIEFRDAVYLMGDLDINSSYLDIDNVKQDATGKVVFAGQYVQGYLQNQMSFDSRYAAKTDISRTSTLGGDVTVHGGSLQIVEDAIVNIGGMLDIGGKLSVDGQQVNTARVDVASGKLNVGATTDASGTGLIRLETNGSLNLTGDAVVTAGQVTLTDATLKMQGGMLTAAGGDLVVAKTSPEVALADEGAAEKTYDVSVTGGTLDIGGQTLELGSGTSMELSGGQVTAGQVKLDAATLEMAGTAKLTATSGDLSVLNAGGISMTGGTLDIGSNKLELGTGAELDVSGGQVSADQVALTGAKLTIGGDAQVDALGGIEAQKAELVMQGGSLNAGTLELVDATLQMDAGVLDASTGGVRLSDSASLVLNGGSLNVGENDIELGADMKLSLGESALVSAGKITVRESATFSVSAASSGKKQAPLAQTLTPVDNMDPTLKGAMLSADLELMGGSTYDATGGSVSLGGHELTLSTSDASKINLVLTLDSLSDPDAQIIIFSDVAMVNFLFNLEVAPVVAGEDGNVSVSASNYFDNDWKDDYYINFDKAAGLVYLSSGLPSDPSEPGATPGTPAVPEPSSTALGLMALAGLAMRRRRK